MKRLVRVAVFGAGLLAGGIALAEQQTVTLNVSGMTCASCPYIVKQSLVVVPGVEQVSVSLEKGMAIVIFDDARTNVAALTQATTAMGFPSKIRRD